MIFAKNEFAERQRERHRENFQNSINCYRPREDGTIVGSLDVGMEDRKRGCTIFIE